MHPGNIFVQTDDPENPRYAAVDFGIVGTLAAARPALSRGEFSRVLRPRLWPRRGAAHRIRLGSQVRTRGRARVRGAHRVRADLQQAAQGNLVRAGAAAPVRGRAPFRHAGSAAARPPAEDAAQHRGTGTAALSRARSVEDGAAHPAPMDARAHEPANVAEAGACPAAGHGRGAEAAAAALQHGRARGRRGPPALAGAERGIEGLRRELRATALRRDIALGAAAFCGFPASYGSRRRCMSAGSAGCCSSRPRRALGLVGIVEVARMGQCT